MCTREQLTFSDSDDDFDSIIILARKSQLSSLVAQLGTTILTSFSFLTFCRVEMDISYHFHKIRSKYEILSPTFTNVKGPISCLS